MDISHKQYLLSSTRRTITGMSELGVCEGKYLYIGEQLPVKSGRTASGKAFILIGDAYCCDQYPREAIEDLNTVTGEALDAITRYWTGRWMLILDNELITDACGLMSAFYYRNGDEWMISSSLALICRQAGIEVNKTVAKNGLTWQLLPSTISPDVRLLLCTQKMTIGDTLEMRYVDRFSLWKGLSYEGRITAITGSLTSALKNIERFSCRKIWLALTAGKDSRLTFAAAKKAGVTFDTYTARHKNMSEADRHLPEVISAKYGIRHHLLDKGKYTPSKYEEYFAFTGGNSLGADAEFYATGQFDQVPDDAVVIKSGLFEAGQSYARRIAGGNETSFADGMKTYYRSSFVDESQTLAFDEWMEYQRRNPMPGIDIRDRFYLEQRLNGWASAIEQSLTINPFSSIQIANSAVVLGCLLYASEEDRKDLRLSYDLIRKLDEKLLEYPVNQRCWQDQVRIVLNGLKKRLHL